MPMAAEHTMYGYLIDKAPSHPLGRVVCMGGVEYISFTFPVLS